MFVRCPECQYALWNLKARACPECSRAFSLDEWDFRNSDALFACRACGDRLIGHTPEELPSICPACGNAVERRLVLVQRGHTGRDVPRRDPWEAKQRLLVRACTVTMMLGFVGLAALLAIALNNTAQKPEPSPSVIVLAVGMMLIGVYGAWPGQWINRFTLVIVLILVSLAGSIGSYHLQAQNHARLALSMRQSHYLRGVAQGMAVSMHQTGTLPADPQGLVDLGYLAPEHFFPRTVPSKPTTTPTPLPNGWLTVGEMHIDWTSAAWQPGATSVLTTVYEHSLRPDGLLVAFSDGRTEWIPWSDVPQQVPAWNQVRAATGLPPIPAGALPPP